MASLPQLRRCLGKSAAALLKSGSIGCLSKLRQVCMLQSSEFLYLEREVHMASIWRSGNPTRLPPSGQKRLIQNEPPQVGTLASVRPDGGVE